MADDMFLINEPNGLYIQKMDDWKDGTLYIKYCADLRGGNWSQWCALSRIILSQDLKLKSKEEKTLN